MSLFDTARDDAEDILGDPDGFTVATLITTPAEIVFGTLDPEDLDNQIRGFPGDHFTQYDAESMAPQAGLNAKITYSLKTLLDEGVIADTVELDFVDYQIAWLDPTSGNRRDFRINSILPTRSLTHIVLILGDLEIIP